MFCAVSISQHAILETAIVSCNDDTQVVLVHAVWAHNLEGYQNCHRLL